MYRAFELSAMFGPACLIGLVLACIGGAIVYFSKGENRASVGFGAGIVVAGFAVLVFAPWIGYGSEKEVVWKATVAQCQVTPGCNVEEVENKLYRNQFPIYRRAR